MAAETRSPQVAPTRDGTGIVAELSQLFQKFNQALFDPYRPELHYMRGPGPKCRARHVAKPAARYAMTTGALVPARLKR